MDPDVDVFISYKKSPAKQAQNLPCRAVTKYLLYYLRTVLIAECEFSLNIDSHVKSTIMFW